MTNGVSSRFVVLVALFVTCLVTANIIAVKLVDIAGLVLPAAMVIFPVSYILGDVVTEVYGYRRMRRLIWLGFACNLIAVAAIWAGGALPAAALWDGQTEYERILGLAPRILAASFAAYLVGEFVNAYVLARMKVMTEGRLLWARTIGSTLIGQGLDSTVFITLAFWGVMPPAAIAAAIATQWLVKCAYEAAATPLTYAAVNYLKRADGVDAVDRDIDFNPLALGR